MSDLFAKCGINCSRCPSYRENLKTDEDRQKCSDGWYKYFGFRLSPEKLLLCDGCQMPKDEKPVRYYKSGCYLRKCAEKNGVVTCAQCSGYPCEEVKQWGTRWTREAVAARLGIQEEAIPEEDYLAFIEPYESLKHLAAIRASLTPEDIVEMTKPSPVRARTFPADLPFSKEGTSAFEAVHRLLAKIISISGETHARQTILEKEKKYLLKLLWAFGLYGELRDEDGTHLKIDSETYYAQLRGVPFYSTWEHVKHRFKLLKEHGVHCDLVPVKEEGWLTPKGALRKGTWFMNMSFDGAIGGEDALKALKSYTAQLHEKYGKRAFRYFSKADMRVFCSRI